MEVLKPAELGILNYQFFFHQTFGWRMAWMHGVTKVFRENCVFGSNAHGGGRMM